MVKVLVQVNSLALGGTQLNAVDFAVAVREWGYESVLVGPRDTIPEGPALFEVARDRGVEVNVFDRPRTTWQGALLMSKLARRHGAELVHIYGSWTARPALLGPCLFGRRPLALTIYEMSVDPETPKSPALIVGTRYLLEDLAQRAEGVELISPPVDTERDDSALVEIQDFLSDHAIDEGRLRIVTVTRLDGDMKAYGVELAIAAADMLAPMGAVLVIVGDGNAVERIATATAIVNARHGRQVVLMTGALADPRPAYAAADVVIGMGGSAARALSFGKPLVVTGEYGWFKTFNPNTAEGLFRNSFWSDVAVKDPVGDLVSCLKPLLDDAQLRRKLGDFGREFAIAEFGLPAMASRLANIYARSMEHYGFRVWARDLPFEITSFYRRVGATIELAWQRGKKLGASVVSSHRIMGEKQ